MKLIEIIEPPKPQNGNVIFGASIAPIDRLKTFSDKQFEDMVHEWVYSYLNEQYNKVYIVGGAGDKGRDIIGYYDSGRTKADIYQCKHYNAQLVPSKYWIEFGKLCYYTYMKVYSIPEKYYIVTSQGLNAAMLNYLESPETIAGDLIVNWDKYCKKKITDKQEIELTPQLKEYIEKFDFSIVTDIEPIRLIDQYSTTKWYKYRFGGGIPPRPQNTVPPACVSTEEQQMEYVKQLVTVYNKEDDKIIDIESLKFNNTYHSHFIRQREAYFMAQALKRFSRDEFVGEPYEEVKKEIYGAVIDISLENYKKNIDRVNRTLSEARKVSLDGNELGKINPSDKAGMCHELVNDSLLKWRSINEKSKHI